MLKKTPPSNSTQPGHPPIDSSTIHNRRCDTFSFVRGRMFGHPMVNFFTFSLTTFSQLFHTEYGLDFLIEIETNYFLGWGFKFLRG